MLIKFSIHQRNANFKDSKFQLLFRRLMDRIEQLHNCNCIWFYNRNWVLTAVQATPKASSNFFLYGKLKWCDIGHFVWFTTASHAIALSSHKHVCQTIKRKTFLALLPLAASPVQYKITSGNSGGAFGIHNSTGLIFIACALDYEKIKKVSELRGIAIVFMVI